MLGFTLRCFTNDDTFPFFIQYGGHDDPLYLHYHSDFSELALVTDGSARHIADGDSYKIGKGDIFVISGSTCHAFEETDKLRLINIMFDPKLLPAADISDHPGFRALFAPEQNTGSKTFGSRLHLAPDDMDNVSSITERIQREYTEKRIGWKTAAQGDFMNLVVVLSRLYDLDRTKNSEGMEKIANAAAYIEENYSESISVAQLAEMSNYSLRQFIRLFKKVFGCIPTEYIANLRMQKARELLRGKNHSITDIALFCGYGDSNYFSRIFRKYNGMTPSEYRAMF